MKNFIFYASYFEAVSDYPEEMQKNTFFNLITYAMTGKLPKKMSKDEKLAFTLIQPIIEKSLKKSDNGKKGGAPKGNKNAVKDEKQKTSKKQAKNKQTHQDIIFEPTNQRLFGDILVGNYIKKLAVESRTRANKTVDNLKKKFEATLAFYKNSEFENIFNLTFETFAYILESAPKKFNGKNYDKQKLEQIINSINEERLLSIVRTVKFSSDIEDMELYYLGCLINSQ